MNVLVTGATGFIGSALCYKLSSDNKVIGIYHRKRPVDAENVIWEQADPPASPEPACHCKARAGRRERPARLALRSIAGRWRAGLTDYNSAAAICEKYSYPNQPWAEMGKKYLSSLVNHGASVSLCEASQGAAVSTNHRINEVKLRG